MRTIARLLAAFLIPAAPTLGAAEGVDYARDVKPLLARHCVGCHGEAKPRAKLRLDTAALALRGGRGGPSVVPGKAEESPLWLAVVGDGDTDRMPLNRPPLSDAEVETLRAWIDSGAPHPADEVASTPPEDVHWAFVAPARPEPPAVRREDWARNPIDRFILAPLERDGIDPSPEADRATLLRRVSLDLIGLPPSPEELAEFLADASPDAYETVVDRLLESPHYGERWARPWLDLARYADSNGYSIDAPRSIWPYRDWVIDALNADMPFDAFATEQLAGDLLPDATVAQRVATGFHRNTQINQEGGIDPEQFRVEAVLDRANTTATAFLGLTAGCAQCHDHKYDPISQREYYQLFAFFNNCDEPAMPVAAPEDVARREAVQAEIDAYLAKVMAEVPGIMEAQRAWEVNLDMVGRQKQSQEVRTVFDTPFADRSPGQHATVFAAFVDQAEEAAEYRKAVRDLRKQMPEIVTTLVVRERKAPRETHLLLGGDFTRPGDPVEPGVPAILPPLTPGEGTPDRLDLARWLFAPEHPLTARVTVNRIWQALFGRGLVETENDFGTQGAPPSHPELLDWLAVEFREDGWSRKRLIRRIVTSATYRQASAHRPELDAVDPENRRLARQSRLRLEAELVRDAALAASGLLHPAIGGPSVYPPQPDGVMSLGQMRRSWETSDGPDRYRRGLYTFFWRATPHPLLMVFDAPDSMRSCTRRPRSNTPLQALTLLNDEVFVECARALAGRALAEAPEAVDAARLDRAFRLALGRGPTDRERDRLVALLDARRAAGPEDDAWATVGRVLLNLDEFITRE